MFWQHDAGQRQVGRVELKDDSLDLEATVPPAPPERIALKDIATVNLSRGSMSLGGRAGPLLTMGSLDRPGALRELAELLFAAIVV